MVKLWKEIASASGAKIYALLTGIVTLVLTGRILGPGGRGTVATIMTWVALVSTCGYLSLGQVAIHRATRLRGQSWLGPTLGSLLVLTCIISCAGWLVSTGIFVATHGMAAKGIPTGLLIIGFLALPFMVWEQYGSSLLMAIDEIRIYNRAQVLGRTVGFVLVATLLCVFHWRESGALVATLMAQMTISIAGIGRLWKQAGVRVRPDWETTRDLLQGGIKLHLNAIGSFLFMSTDVLVINRYRGPAETGQYQLAVQLTGILLLIPQAATTVLFSKTTQLGPDGVWPIQRRILGLLTLGMCVIGIVGAAVSPWIIPFVMGRDFRPAVPVFQLLMLNLIGMTFSTVMASQWIGRGLFWQVAVLTLTVGVLNFAANCALVPRFGMYGSVAATLGTYMIAIATNAAMAIWVDRRIRENAGPVPQPGL